MPPRPPTVPDVELTKTFAGVDELADPYLALRFNKQYWLSSGQDQTRKKWILDEYARAKRLGLDERPWTHAESSLSKNQWIDRDLKYTYDGNLPWEDAKLQDFHGETRKQWMNYKRTDVNDYIQRVGDTDVPFQTEQPREVHEPDPVIEPKGAHPKPPVDLPEPPTNIPKQTAGSGVPIKGESDAVIGTGGNNVEMTDLGKTEPVPDVVRTLIELNADDPYVPSDRVTPELHPSGETAGGTARTGWRSRFFGKRKTPGGTTEGTPGSFIGGEELPDDGFYDSDTEASFEDSVEMSRIEGQQREDVEDLEGKASEPGDVPRDTSINAPVTEADMAEFDPAPPYDAADPFSAQPAGTRYGGLQDRNDTLWTRFKRQIGYQDKPPTNDLTEKLLGDVEMGPLNERGPNLGGEMQLSQRPNPNEVNVFDGPMRGGVSEMVRLGVADGANPTSVLSELGFGMSGSGSTWLSKSGVMSYLKKQGKGLMMAPLIAPLIAGLEAFQPGLGDTVSLGMVTADLAMSGDPLGIAVYAMQKYFSDQAAENQRRIDNDEPDKDYGTKLGYVREGNTWYPAIYNKKTDGNGDYTMTMDYGHEVVWKLGPDGRMMPMIPDAKNKEFRITDAEWDGQVMGQSLINPEGDGYSLQNKEYVQGGYTQTGGPMRDTTRDWYFLDGADAKNVWTNEGEHAMAAYTEDTSTMNPVVRQLDDWRKALNWGQDWKWSSAIQTMGKGAALNNYDGSRGLQRRIQEGTVDPGRGIRLSDNMDYDQYVRNASNNQVGDHSIRDSEISSYIYDTVLKEHMGALYSAQTAAAREAGFGETYSLLEENYHNMDVPRVWSAMYLDTAKDMETASNAEELATQLHDIEMYNDRTPAQRNYLAQKVQMRYWMQQATQMGGTDDMMQHLLGRESFNQDPYGNRTNTTAAVSRFLKLTGKVGWEDNSNSAERQHLDKMTGFSYPWQNAGETILPTLTGTLRGEDVGNYLGDYNKAAYDRMSAEAVANTTEWVNRTGGLDPNLLLEGTNYKLQEGGIYHSATNQQDVVWDEFLGKEVPIGSTSKWTEWDKDKDEYVLTEEGKAEKMAADFAREHDSEKTEGQIEDENAAWAAEVERRKHVKWQDEQGMTGAGEDDKIVTVDDRDVEKVDLEGANDAWGQHEQGGDDYGGSTSYTYDLPSSDWRYIDPERGEMFGTYIAPDGTQFPENRYGASSDGIDMYDYETEILAKAKAQLEAEWWAQEEERDRELRGEADLGYKKDRREHAKEAQAEADAEARAAKEARAAALGIDETRGTDIRTKQDIEAQKAAWAEEDSIDALLDRWTREYDEQVTTEREQKRQAEIDTWRQQGIAFGFLDDDYNPTTQGGRPTEASSHGHDSAVATQGVSVQGQHSVDHEEYHFAPMTSAFMDAIRAAEAPAVAAQQGVKVI